MTSRVLFVDDDQAILKSLARNLSQDFEIETATSGMEGLQKIQSGTPFAVIMADMRMPQMDGLKFIEEARKVAPDTLYMMLTGNQDLYTAVRAVNNGNVFRFLTKPCEIVSIRKALKAGIRQYELQHQEKELLQNTFVGSVSLLVDIIETVSPTLLQSSSHIVEIFKQLVTSVSVPFGWEYHVAAKISLIGFALLPESERAEFFLRPATDDRHQAIYKKATASAAGFIARIPRLHLVSEIIRSQALVSSYQDFQHEEDSRNVQPAAFLLRMATEWTLMVEHGMSSKAAARELQQSFSSLPLNLTNLLSNLEEYGSELKDIEIALQELRQGHVLSRDVFDEKGAVLVSRGNRINTAMIDKLSQHDELNSPIRSISVTESSYEAALNFEWSEAREMKLV